MGEAGTSMDEPAVARVGATPRRRFFWMAYRGLAGVFAFDGEKPESFAAPALGQHSDVILGELGLSVAEIAALKKNGVVA